MATEYSTQEYYDAMSKAKKTKDDRHIKAWKTAEKMKKKIGKQWQSGTLTSEKARKADAKMEWHLEDANQKADQAYDKAIAAAKAKQTKVRAETAKGWGRLDPKKKTEKKKTSGVTGSRNFVRRNY